jgi:hypothetical protein
MIEFAQMKSRPEYHQILIYVLTFNLARRRERAKLQHHFTRVHDALDIKKAAHQAPLFAI